MLKKTLRSSILSIFPSFFLISSVLFLWASASAADQINVAVSILPQKYFVEKIGKDRVHISVMVLPGASSATYEPKPRQMINLSKADLYFAIGVPFEAIWLTRFQKINPKMRVVPTQTGVELVPMESAGHAKSHAGNQAESLDPHIWLSPPLVLRQAKTIRDALVKSDPAGKNISKTNMHEFAFGITTNNPFYGPTRNPYDLSRIPGGSSGGSAASVASGFCAGAIGTDTGGSVRIPASLCSLYGLKPTLGRVGRGGMMYLSFTRDVMGPMTRTVMDSALLLKVMAGKDPRDPESSSDPVPNYMADVKGNLKCKKFGVPRKYFFDGIHSETLKTINDAILQIQDMGGVVKDVEVKHMDIATPTGFNIVLAESVYLLENHLKAWNPKATIGEYLDQMGPDVKSVLGGQIGTPESKPVPGYAYTKSVREDRNKMISGFKDAMNGVDALLLPTTPLPAAKIGDDLETDLEGKKVNKFLTFIRDCDPISVVGYPAITVPAGYSSKCLPIGLQIVARPFEEPKLLQIAHAFEHVTKGHKPPTL